MTRNVGPVDRFFRALVIAPIAIVLALAVFGVDTVAGIAALAIAAIMLGTALIRWCPLLRLFGISTCPAPRQGMRMRTGTSR